MSGMVVAFVGIPEEPLPGVGLGEAVGLGDATVLLVSACPPQPTIAATASEYSGKTRIFLEHNFIRELLNPFQVAGIRAV